MRKMCAGRGYGERNPHQVCRVRKSHEVGFELRWRNLLWKSGSYYKAKLKEEVRRILGQYGSEKREKLVLLIMEC